jgi:hypothetical protein
MHIFVATNLKKIKKRPQDLDDDENIIVKRMRYTSAIKKCINGEFQDAKTVAAILVYAKILETDGTFT